VDRELPDRGDELVASFGARSANARLSFLPELLLSAKEGGSYTIDVRSGSWLAATMTDQ